MDDQDKMIMEEIQKEEDVILNSITTDPLKQQGLREWIEWKHGSMRGHHLIGKEIIKRNEIEKEWAQLDIIRKREMRADASWRFRKANPLKVAASNAKFYQDHKEEIDEYHKSDKVKSKRRETEKLKRELLRKHKEEQKWI